MLKYIVKRILQAIPLLLLITLICFTLINLAPYDAIDSTEAVNQFVLPFVFVASCQ